MRKFCPIIIMIATSTLVPISFFTFTRWVSAQPSIAAGQRITYSGFFTNTTYSLGGNVLIEVTFEQNNQVSGYINFTNNPGENTICGAGNFQGIKQDRDLQLRFVSNDPDPGCGFDRGLAFIVNATLSPDGSRLENGTYQINNAQAVVFQAVSQAQIIDPRTPEELIQTIYQLNQPWAEKFIDLDQESVLVQYFDEELTRLIIRDVECRKKLRGLCNLDFDPFAATNGSSPHNGYLNFKLRRLKSKPDVFIEVTFNYVGPTKLIYHTRMTEAGWRISDIVYLHEDGKSSLKSLLSQPISK